MSNEIVRLTADQIQKELTKGFDITSGQAIFNHQDPDDNYRAATSVHSSPELTDEGVSQPTPEQLAHRSRAEYIFNPEQLEKVAEKIVDQALKITTGDRLLIQFHSTGWQLTSMVTKLARERGAQVIFRYDDSDLKSVVLSGIKRSENLIPLLESLGETIDVLDSEDESRIEVLIEKAEAAGKLDELISCLEDSDQFSLPSLPPRPSHETFAQRAEHFIWDGMATDIFDDLVWSTKVLIIRNKAASPFEIDDTVKKLNATATKFLTDSRVQERSWLLTYVPTPGEAEIAGMAPSEYINMFLEAGNRDWEEVKKAQDILAQILDRGKELSIKSPPPPGMGEEFGVDITLSIEGQTFANSTIQKNFPGSEVFSSPKAGTLKGHYGVPYPVMFDAGANGGMRVLPYVWFDFAEGKVIKAVTDSENQAFLDQILALDGANIVGEIALGTNPKIPQAVPNTLLVEKALGVHLAVGESYAYKEYDGKPVNVDNGNRSQIHIDIARVLTAAYADQDLGTSQVIVDGQVIQENGKFIDRRLAILDTP